MELFEVFDELILHQTNAYCIFIDVHQFFIYVVFSAKWYPINNL